MMMTDQKKKPPMAKAIREFVTAMQFPPTLLHGLRTEQDYAGLIIAMLQFANGVPEGSTTATCSPSIPQVAALLHCSPSTVKRLLKDLRDAGLMIPTPRGRVSTIYT